MQVTETVNQGLKRGFRVVVPADQIQGQVLTRLTEIGLQSNLPGFRPGKAPMSVLRQRFGKAVMGEVLEQTVNAGVGEAFASRSLRPALQPKIALESFEDGKDLAFTVDVEVLPTIAIGDLKGIEVERPVLAVEAAEIDDALQRVAKEQRSWNKVERAAAKGDSLAIDFTGYVDGQAFEGGAAKGHVLELGSNAFIAGFEDQLVGTKAGQHVSVKLSFPEAYVNDKLAGKPAVFEVDVVEVREAKLPAVDDALAAALGFDNLEALKKAVGERIAQEFKALGRNKMKRALFDKLSAAHDFAVPEGMVQAEFDAIWTQLQQELKQTGAKTADATKSEDEQKAEYRKLAERRVKLGLLLAEIGQVNNLEVKPEEINRALSEQARRFPGQEKQVIDYFRSNAQALNQLRAPLFEEKVVDFVLEMAKVAERSVTKEELLKDDA
ncbi:MAG: trigger factor [Alphaproteobacteria bacterium]|nr:trigger factor [Alphaproteobacteria bacterium]